MCTFQINNGITVLLAKASPITAAQFTVAHFTVADFTDPTKNGCRIYRCRIFRLPSLPFTLKMISRILYGLHIIYESITEIDRL